MKSLVVLGLIFLSAMANANTLVSEQVVTLPVDLSTAGIRLSKAGYSAPTVKVLIPELAAVTVLNHRNEGETAPCLATFQAILVEEVVQGKPEVLQVPVSIKLEKIFGVIEDENGQNICQVRLMETVTASIRGFDFSHVRFGDLPSRHVDDCK
ncbi:hypothetical protein AZI86_17345 [Bdellovibrio bacteriovorus]|uniref:Bdellovibrio beta-sandwich domain-containing protein n=1 Tax=Bdellovibrio bacteriovorus TaxID=959 RepID=A0A150WED7_BDEBC|nr:hypothetical protein [Bdellovibrio bacteriovorus]KYG61478.1 hypothetical protein AZI86_17345 [Bdellovibrio bacteriovorus]